MMENVTTSIQDVQNFFLKNVSSKTILIGHSLENDLRALKVILANKMLKFWGLTFFSLKQNKR